MSPEFAIGGVHGWRLGWPCEDDDGEGTHVSLFLYTPEDYVGSTRLHFQLFLAHPSDRSKTVVVIDTNVFSGKCCGAGYPKFFPLAELTEASGFVVGNAVTVGVNALVLPLDEAGA